MDLTAAQWEKLKPLLAPKRRSVGRGRPWRDTQAVLNGVLWVLRTGAPWHDLPARGKLDLSETFIDASFSSAKKGALLSARLAEEKAVKSWRSQTAMVFLSPCTWSALRRMKPRSSNPRSRADSCAKHRCD